MDWKTKAEELFFISRKKIICISGELGVSRQSIAAHLKNCKGFSNEKQRRKDESAAQRKDYQADWEQKNRKGRKQKTFNIDRGLLKRQHEIDVRVLSAERFFNETGE